MKRVYVGMCMWRAVYSSVQQSGAFKQIIRLYKHMCVRSGLSMYLYNIAIDVVIHSAHIH